MVNWLVVGLMSKLVSDWTKTKATWICCTGAIQCFQASQLQTLVWIIGWFEEQIAWCLNLAVWMVFDFFESLNGRPPKAKATWTKSRTEHSNCDIFQFQAMSGFRSWKHCWVDGCFEWNDCHWIVLSGFTLRKRKAKESMLDKSLGWNFVVLVGSFLCTAVHAVLDWRFACWTSLLVVLFCIGSFLCTSWLLDVFSGLTLTGWTTSLSRCGRSTLWSAPRDACSSPRSHQTTRMLSPSSRWSWTRRVKRSLVSYL